MAAPECNDFLVGAAKEIDRHAARKLRYARKLWRVSKKLIRQGRGADAERLWEKSQALEKEAMQGFSTVQKILYTV